MTEASTDRHRIQLETHREVIRRLLAHWHPDTRERYWYMGIALAPMDEDQAQLIDLLQAEAEVGWN